MATEKKENTPNAKKDGNNAAATVLGCLSKACKTKVKQFGFCEEHFDQFKFGLIKKTGEPVSDFDKKFDHYVAFKKKRSAQKVA